MKTMTNGSSPKPSLTYQGTLKELKIVFHTLLRRLMIAAWLWESSCMVFHVCVGTCEHVCTSLCPGSEKGGGALLTQPEPRQAFNRCCYLVSQVLRLCCSNAAGAKIV